MKKLKNALLAICSLALTPMFLAQANEDEIQTLMPGCYQINTYEESMQFCVKDGADIIPIEHIEEINGPLEEHAPVTLCL